MKAVRDSRLHGAGETQAELLDVVPRTFCHLADGWFKSAFVLRAIGV